ncbi:zinc finger MYM-type protein 1-like [Trifolium pratense]|uniref:zinc finger MYM-type protein 1-like n=1 Tax=Trifolium pratense TaxID=57577 RepID=UPI001E6934C8|nr:zinc finger MYM-type protein 1-like [Trifolium pratense]XP_045822722.1 zinc finger MYM-type protein 1-like [Trifolium pratense]XP_045822723.1 zinc finger MYM-type protein 1-like [Trifolium pratense]
MVNSQRKIDSFFKRKVTQKDEERFASTFEPGKCLENPRIEENEKQLSEVSRVEYDEFEKDSCEEESDQDGHDENVSEVQNSDQIMKKRICLKTLIDIVRFLTFQEVAFIDLRETSEERYRYSFLSMVEFTKECDDEFAEAVLENASYISKCASFEFQKVVLRILSSKVKNHIREEIGDSKFCIFVDGVWDEPRVALVLKFVDKNGFIQERFFDFVDVEEVAPLALKEEVCAILSRHNLDVSNIRGQGYDGISDIREEWNDLRTLFFNECPYAYHIHGFAHKLELALVGASTQVTPVQLFFSNLIYIVKFFCTCRKPNDESLAAELYKIAHLLDNDELGFGEVEDELCLYPRVGDARSMSYFSAICNLIMMYDAACCLLENLFDKESTYCQRWNAHTAYNYFTTFEFILILHLMRDIMGITDTLCQALQQQSLDVVNVKHLLRSTKALLQNMRQDGWDKLLKNVTSFCEKNDIRVPQFSAPHVVRPRRRHPQNEENITIEHYYREQVFFIAIDIQIQELNCRLSDQAMELLTLSSALVPKDTYKAFNIDHICTLVEKYYPVDFNEQEKINLRSQLCHFIIEARQESSLKSLSNIQELCACLAATKKSEVYYLIDRLLRLIMTLPISTPTTERSSSAMKVIKTMLKEKMEDEFRPDSVIIYIEREIAKSVSLDSVADDLESLEERNDSQLYRSVNDYINKPLELLGEEESEGSVPLQVADDMVEDDVSSRLLAELLGEEKSDGSPLLQVAEDMVEDGISSRGADLSVPNLGVEATSDATAHLSVSK